MLLIPPAPSVLGGFFLHLSKLAVGKQKKENRKRKAEIGKQKKKSREDGNDDEKKSKGTERFQGC